MKIFSCCDIECVYINEFSVLLFVDKFNRSPPPLISLCQHRVLIILEVIDSIAYEIRLKLGQVQSGVEQGTQYNALQQNTTVISG